MDFPVDPDVAINDQPLPSARVPPPLIPQAPAGPQPQQPAAPWQDYQTVFTNAKAGMESVDKGYDSAHFRNEQRKAAQLATRISQLKARSAAITPAELAAATRAVDQRISSLECRRDLSRTWLHADMDCFYAAVHEAERPELKRLPVAVGGMDMISTANYVARKYGVRSAMPGFIGKRLCPQHAFSRAAEELRNRVRESCGGLTCSCGVAPNKMLAKICSDINKPDGQYVLPPRRAVILSFLDTLPLVESLAADMAAEQLEGRNLTLKLKLSTFEVRTRAATMPRYVRTASDMLPTVLRLLRAEGPLELRLMGVRMAALRK
ncbi:hypothetical protein VOLCADRAFT_118878, partial [Volvox carteri f. nagariensis]